MNDIKDLKILIDNTFLNIRVAILLETPYGFVFEKSKYGYLFLLGWRVKLNETTQKAILREIFEELKLKNINTKMIAVIENFFSIENNKKYHEFNFIYRALIHDLIDLSVLKSDNDNNEYIYIKTEDFDKYDIRPKEIKKILKNNKEFIHLVNYE